MQSISGQPLNERNSLSPTVADPILPGAISIPNDVLPRSMVHGAVDPTWITVFPWCGEIMLLTFNGSAPYECGLSSLCRIHVAWIRRVGRKRLQIKGTRLQHHAT